MEPRGLSQAARSVAAPAADAEPEAPEAPLELLEDAPDPPYPPDPQPARASAPAANSVTIPILRTTAPFAGVPVRPAPSPRSTAAGAARFRHSAHAQRS